MKAGDLLNKIVVVLACLTLLGPAAAKRQPSRAAVAGLRAPLSSLRLSRSCCKQVEPGGTRQGGCGHNVRQVLAALVILSVHVVKPLGLARTLSQFIKSLL